MPRMRGKQPLDRRWDVCVIEDHNRGLGGDVSEDQKKTGNHYELYLQAARHMRRDFHL